MTGFIRDLKAGVQQLIRRPGFTAAAIASLALGIGLNTTLFSVVNARAAPGQPVRRAGPAGRDLHRAATRTSRSSRRPIPTTSTSATRPTRSRAWPRTPYVRGILSTGDRRRWSPARRSRPTTSTCSASGPRSAAASAPTRTPCRGQRRGRRAESRPVAAALRRPRRHRRPDHQALGRRLHRRRRRARRLHRHAAGHPARVLGAGDDGGAPQFLRACRPAPTTTRARPGSSGAARAGCS